MSDENENKPTLTRKPLTLSRSVESGEVKQTFSHGRTNKVVVEVKRRKLVGKPGYTAEPEVEVAAPLPPPPSPVAAPAPVLRQAANDMLSRQERQAKLLREAEEARLTMLEESGRREVEQRAKAAENDRRRSEDSQEIEAEITAAPAPAASPVAAIEETPVAEAAANADGAAPAPRRFTPVKRPSVLNESAKKLRRPRTVRRVIAAMIVVKRAN